MKFFPLITRETTKLFTGKYISSKGKEGYTNILDKCRKSDGSGGGGGGGEVARGNFFFFWGGGANTVVFWANTVVFGQILWYFGTFKNNLIYYKTMFVHLRMSA